MRTLRTIERDLMYHRAIAASQTLGAIWDNDGFLVASANQRRASSVRAIERLAKERDDLLRVLARSERVR